MKKKISWATHKSLFGQIATCSCILAASAGIVFGVSAGTFKINYFNLNDADARVKAAQTTNYYSQNIKSQWNMNDKFDANGVLTIPGQEQPYFSDLKKGADADAWWKATYGDLPKWCDKEDERGIDPTAMELTTAQGEDISSDAQAARKKYGTLVIDGATHVALDRSFNQSLYNGIANFVTNKIHDVKAENEGLIYKPSQDSTQEFVNIYRKAAEATKVLCLAGFNHVTPLNALGKQDGPLYKFDDKNIAKTGMLLIDGDVTNNQNIASVLFRSDQPAFLTALAACMYFYNNLDMYHDHFQDIAVAAYGGTAIPTVAIYMGGFQRGVEFFNEFILKRSILNESAKSYMQKAQIEESDYDHFLNQLLPASKYKDEIETIKEMKDDETKTKKINEMLQKLYDEYSIKMIKLGDYGTHFSGSFAQGDAIGITKQYLNRGASAIICVAGPQSLDTAQEIMNQNKNCIVIGVDCAMENGDYQKPFKNPAFRDKTPKAADGSESAQVGNILKFSAVKDMTSVSDKILRLAADGKNWDVDNIEPWITTATIPTWKPEQEFKAVKITLDKENKRFDVEGFETKPTSDKQDVLVIPTVYEEDGVTYYLRDIKNGTGGIPFDDDNLKNFTTLKLTGLTKTDRDITFTDNAFNFKEENKNGFHYIDLTEVPCGAIGKAGANPFGAMGSGESKVLHKGVVKLGPSASIKEQQLAYTNLFDAYRNSWQLVEADPSRSICSFGFKTCGNIENGLISISWDGWPLLVDCLRHLNGIGNPSFLTTNNFFDVWDTKVDEYFDYCTQHQIQLPPFTKEQVYAGKVKGSNWRNLYTFDRSSKLHEGYSHLMTILGWTLKVATLYFSPDMTIILDETGAPRKARDDTPLSILEWLRYNMYFVA